MIALGNGVWAVMASDLELTVSGEKKKKQG